jgi:DHA1 family inner membrane transport protein
LLTLQMEKGRARVKTKTSAGAGTGHVGVSALLFLLLFSAQAGLIVLSPVLADVARDLDVSTAQAGQIRTVAGLVAAIAALASSRAARRVGLRRQLLAGTALLALGSLTSAAAPSFVVLALAQAPIGAGVGILTTSATLAAAAWVGPPRRTRALSWALIGQPAAWIVGMPLAGLVGAASWRYGWLALPFVAATAAGVVLARGAGRPEQSEPVSAISLRAALGEPGVSRWFAGEVLANTAWAGTLVFAGPLFVESYGASSTLAGVLLAVAAGAYVLGNMAVRRLLADEPGRLLFGLVLALGSSSALFGAYRHSLVVSAVLFSAAGFAAGARTLVSSAFGLAASPQLRAALLGARSASMQIGYVAGSLLTGAALAVGGYAALGVVVGTLFLAGAAVLARAPLAKRRTRAVVASCAERWNFGFSGLWRSSTALRRWRWPGASRALSSYSSC